MNTKTRLLFGLGNAGSVFIWTFTGSFLTQYYTDSVLISAAFIGTMMLIMRLADGVTDIVQGVLIEKTNTRFGKARPWLMVSILPLIITTALVFNVPASLSGTGKLVYICITYFLMATIFYTMFSLGYWSMLQLVTSDPHERNKLSSISNICGFVAGLVISTGTVPLLNAFGGSRSQTAWRVVAIAFTTIALILAILCVISTREKKLEKSDKRPEGYIKTGVTHLLHTKYFYIALTFAVCTSMVGAIVLGAPVYFSRDVLGNSNYYPLLALAYVLPTLFGLGFAPRLYKIFGKRRVMGLGCAVAVLGRIVGIFNPYSLGLTIVGTIISAVGMSLYASGLWTQASEIVDYLEPRIGMRIEGLATTATSFGNKVGTGLGAAALGWSLAAGGYDPGAAVQTVGVQKAEIFLLYAVPIIMCSIAFFMMFLWTISDEPKAKLRKAPGGAAPAGKSRA
jgi:GPH family glycoside/pentoside/hexuronide:cation symporter